MEAYKLAASLADLLDEHQTVPPLDLLWKAATRACERLDPISVVFFHERKRQLDVQVGFGGRGPKVRESFIPTKRDYNYQRSHLGGRFEGGSSSIIKYNKRSSHAKARI